MTNIPNPQPESEIQQPGHVASLSNSRQGNDPVATAMLNAVPDDVLAGYVCQKMITNPKFAEVIRSFDAGMDAIGTAAARLHTTLQKGSGPTV